jgi:hypothetical protein
LSPNFIDVLLCVFWELRLLIHLAGGSLTSQKHRRWFKMATKQLLPDRLGMFLEKNSLRGGNRSLVGCGASAALQSTISIPLNGKSGCRVAY